MRTHTGAVARFALAGGAAVALVALVLPRASGPGGTTSPGALSRPSAPQLALLGLLWFAGLCVHTPSLTAACRACPTRALLLNLSGSFVSNLLPLGGAAGTVVNWRMARTWGFGSGAFSRWAVVTNLADTVVKLALPGIVRAGSPSARPHRRRTRRDGRSRRGRAARGHPARGRPRGPRRPSTAARRDAGPSRVRPGSAGSPRHRRATASGPRGSAPTPPGWSGTAGCGCSAGDQGYAALQGGAALGVPAGWSAARSAPSSSRPPSSSSACSPWSSVAPELSRVIVEIHGGWRGGSAPSAPSPPRPPQGAALPRAGDRHGGARRWSGAARVVGGQPYATRTPARAPG